MRVNYIIHFFYQIVKAVGYPHENLHAVFVLNTLDGRFHCRKISETVRIFFGKHTDFVENSFQRNRTKFFVFARHKHSDDLGKRRVLGDFAQVGFFFVKTAIIVFYREFINIMVGRIGL